MKEIKKKKKKLTLSVSSKTIHNVQHYAKSRQKTSVVIEKKPARKWGEKKFQSRDANFNKPKSTGYISPKKTPINRNFDIRKGDAALTSKGLIGSVFEVYEKYSRVLLISDINSKIPVRVGKNNIKAIISGNNTTKIDLLYLKENLSFNDNDLVYTSGDGGYFNPGIPVGVIKKENNNVYINPLNDLSQVQYINIFINQFKNF